MRHHTFRFKAALTFVALATLSLPALYKTTPLLAHSKGEARVSYDRASLFRSPGYASVLYQSDGEISSRDATAEELSLITESARAGEMQATLSYAPTASTGLRIILRTTPQLEANPQAKAAFLKAAATWESVITTPMSVIINIDYGPTCFGSQVSPTAVGATNPQLLIGDPIYLEFLEHLLNNASTQEELAIYYRAPQPTLPTSEGETSAIGAPSPVFRALGLIDRNADVAPDPPHFGPLPSIWLNSNVPYDFDYTNGIDADKYDFDAVVSREFGRVLGFISLVGELEIDPGKPLAASAWDVFRLPPSATIESFATANRILKSGGNHFSFMGEEDLPLSTGKPDGTGGDGRSASHWKDDELLGRRIGIMDPTFPLGRRQTITLNDLNAMDLFGYSLRPPSSNKPVLHSLDGDLNGTILTLSGSLTDIDGDVVQAQLKFLDKRDRVVGETAPFSADFGILPTQLFDLRIPNMDTLPAVEQATLIVIDTKGNASNALTVDFSGGDSGGPRIKSVAFKDDVLVIKGKKLKSGVQIEVNGVIINPPSGIDTEKSGKTVKVRGTMQELNLRTGPNRVRAIRNGLRSNAFVEEL